MNHMTKMALYALQHENILPVKEIMHYFPMTTTLVSAAAMICESFARALCHQASNVCGLNSCA